MSPLEKVPFSTFYPRWKYLCGTYFSKKRLFQVDSSIWLLITWIITQSDTYGSMGHIDKDATEKSGNTFRWVKIDFRREHDSWIIINVHRDGILPEKLCNIIGLSGKEDFCRTKLCLCNVALAFWLILAHYFRITFLSQTFTIFAGLKASGSNGVKNTIRKRCFTARNGAAQ